MWVIFLSRHFAKLLYFFNFDTLQQEKLIWKGVQNLQYISTVQRGEETSIARHLRLLHINDTSNLKFWGVKLGPIKGNLNQMFLKEEARWIHRLGTLSPNALNEGFSFIPFI